jgi:tetratricopeptide (TPR) repeat protein
MRSLAVALLVLAAASADAGAADATWLPRAEELLRRAELSRDAEDRYALADQAQALAERAMAAQPADPMPHLVAARALGMADPRHPEACRPRACERAAQALKRARDLDRPGLFADRIASELGIVYSRLGTYADALVEYDRALRTVPSERNMEIGLWSYLDRFSERAVLYGNSAETLMALGRLDEAIARYRQAEAEAMVDPQLYAVELELAQFGLGVALDRDEQSEKAEQAIAAAVARDPNMRLLSRDTVFFEPPGDKAYYVALGYEVGGMRPRAIAAWREYLRAQPAARWARRARTRLGALEAARGPYVDPDKALAFVEPVRASRLRSTGDVNRLLDDALDDLRVCAARAAFVASRAHGTVQLTFGVNMHGFLHSVRAKGDAVPAPARAVVERCVEAVAQQLRFPSIDAQLDETYEVYIGIGAQP